MTNAMLHTHSALLSAILEHSGHLHESLENTNISFKDCCKLILILFSSKQYYSHLHRDIEASAKIHLYNIQHQKHPEITQCQWVSTISKKQFTELFAKLPNTWTYWNPDNQFAQICKESIDDILPN